MKTAFNKYNPDDLLTALVDLLKKYELDDAAEKVRKITPEIQRAWRGREASAKLVAARFTDQG